MGAEQRLAVLFEIFFIMLKPYESACTFRKVANNGYQRRACHLTRAEASSRNDLQSVNRIISNLSYCIASFDSLTGMKNDWNSIDSSNTPDIVRSSDSSRDRSTLIFVIDSFPTEVCRAALGHL